MNVLSADLRAIVLEKAKAELAKRKERALATDNFEAFVRYTTPDYGWGWFSREVCADLERFMRAVERGERPRYMLFAPPRIGKSLLVSQKFPAFALGKHPEWDVIATSYSFERAAANNRDVQRLIDQPKYAEVFPNTRIRGETSKGRWLRNDDVFEVVGNRGKYRAAGVNGAITGFGGHVILIDDPIKDRKEAESQVVRDSAWEWYRGTLYTRLEKGAGIFLITTRWHLDDIPGRLLDAEKTGQGDKWVVKNYRAIAEEDELPFRFKGEALHEDRHPLKELEARRLVVGEYNWAAEYQGNPTPRAGGMFRPDSMPLMEGGANPQYNPVFVRAWDLASVADRGDWTTGVLMCAWYSRNGARSFAVIDVVRFRGAPNEVEATIKRTAEMDKTAPPGLGGRHVRISLPEDAGAGGKFQAFYLTQALAGYPVESSRETGSKEVRADPFASQANVGNVYIMRAAWNGPYLDELRNFPNGAHDDQVDASSRAFQTLMEMGGNVVISPEAMARAARRA